MTEEARMTEEAGMTEKKHERTEQRPDRKLKLLVNADVEVPINAAVAANVLSDHSVRYANSEQDVSIDRDDQRH